MMSFSVLGVVFAAAVTAHNLEEAVLFPAWLLSAGRWYPRVGGREFRFAAIILTLAAYVVVGLSAASVPFGDDLLCGYALAMLLNVFVPHSLGTLALRRYIPGTLTAITLVLPSSALLLRVAFLEHRIDLARFVWLGPTVVGMLLLSIPLLFALGRVLLGSSNARA